MLRLLFFFPPPFPFSRSIAPFGRRRRTALHPCPLFFFFPTRGARYAAPSSSFLFISQIRPWTTASLLSEDVPDRRRPLPPEGKLDDSLPHCGPRTFSPKVSLSALGRFLFGTRLSQRNPGLFFSPGSSSGNPWGPARCSLPAFTSFLFFFPPLRRGRSTPPTSWRASGPVGGPPSRLFFFFWDVRAGTPLPFFLRSRRPLPLSFYPPFFFPFFFSPPSIKHPSLASSPRTGLATCSFFLRRGKNFLTRFLFPLPSAPQRNLVKRRVPPGVELYNKPLSLPSQQARRHPNRRLTP